MTQEYKDSLEGYPQAPNPPGNRALSNSTLLRAARTYEQIIFLAFVLFPALPIGYLVFLQTSTNPLVAHRFHEIAIAIAIAQSSLIAFATWRCYLQSGERFLYWLSLGLISFTLFYAPHGVLTTVAHENLSLFLIFGPISRLAFAIFLVVALAQYNRPADALAERRRTLRWLPWLVSFVVVDIAVVLSLTSMSFDTMALRRNMEIVALALEICAAIALFFRHGRSPLLKMYVVATAYFAFSSISFLLSRPWSHQWWLAHLIFASGFLLLSMGVLRAFQTTKSFAGVYSQEEWVERLASEKRRVELALSEQEVLTLKLEEQSRALARSNRDLENFASVAAHDLKEPLRKVTMFGERLQSHAAESLDEKGRKFLDVMVSATHRMHILLDSLLTYSRVSTQVHSFEDTNLSEVIEAVKSDLAESIHESKTRISCSKLPIIQADYTQMRQLFQNLIANAIRYSKQDVAPQINIEWNASSPGRTGFEIIVSDNGIGFEQDQADSIFEVFKRLHTQGEYPGTGIGLAVCQRIMERHNGSIRAESEPGKGARFILNFP